MLDRVDRIQVAVKDRARAAETYRMALGAEVAEERPSQYLAAMRTILALGESRIELCEPRGPGIVADWLATWGEGLLSAGLSTPDPDALRRRLAKLGMEPVEEDGQLYLPPERNFGMRFVISASRPAPRIGPVSFLYEVTNTLVSDWQQAATHFAGLFGLDPLRFSPISSKRFGYEGTLTLFGPPSRLDRIELSQVRVDGADAPGSAMARWGKKHGDGLYMCYVETHDLQALITRLNAAGARWTPRGARPDNERDGLWVHPSALHGVLLGVSRTTLAWEWSGRPDLVAPAP